MSANVNLSSLSLSDSQAKLVASAMSASYRCRSAIKALAASASSLSDPELVAILREQALGEARKVKVAKQAPAAQQAPAVPAVPAVPANVPAAQAGLAEQLLAALAAMLQQQAPAVPAAQAEPVKPAKREPRNVMAKRPPMGDDGFPLPWVLSATRSEDGRVYFRFGIKGRSWQSCSLPAAGLRDIITLNKYADALAAQLDELESQLG